jgi:hypothetical protein
MQYSLLLLTLYLLLFLLGAWKKFIAETEDHLNQQLDSILIFRYVMKRITPD